MSREREQKLVDLMFSMAITLADPNTSRRKSPDDVRAWVVERLRQNGFPTRPVGMSWGVLVAEDERPIPPENKSLRSWDEIKNISANLLASIEQTIAKAMRRQAKAKRRQAKAAIPAGSAWQPGDGA